MIQSLLFYLIPGTGHGIKLNRQALQGWIRQYSSEIEDSLVSSRLSLKGLETINAPSDNGLEVYALKEVLLHELFLTYFDK